MIIYVDNTNWYYEHKILKRKKYSKKPLNRESVELGFILKQIKGYEFSTYTFADRLKLQKLIYLLQACGVYLGYDYSWYLRGPYCSLLAHNAFSLEEIYHKIPNDIKLEDKTSRKNFEKFLKFVANKNVDELEIAASLHYLKNTTPNTDKEIKTKVTQKRDKFTMQQINEIWSEMKKCQII